MPGTRLGTLHTLSSDAQDNCVRQMLSITLFRDEGMEAGCLQGLSEAMQRGGGMDVSLAAHHLTEL